MSWLGQFHWPAQEMVCAKVIWTERLKSSVLSDFVSISGLLSPSASVLP